VIRQFINTFFDFLRWLFSAWWELLISNSGFLRSKEKKNWLLNNIEAVTVLVITVLSIILMALVINDPSVIFLFKNPKTDPIWEIK